MTEPRRQTSPKIPRGEARRRELLTVAARILLRDGLDGTSMDQIALEAGASKATLYRHFKDKHGLVVDVVQFLCDDFIADVDQEPLPGADLCAGLTTILNDLIRVLSKPDHPAFFRLIVAGSQKDPGIGKTWHDYGPLVWHAMLRRVIEAQRTLGHIRPDADTTDLPEMLFDAVFADTIIRTAVLGDTTNADRAPGRYIERIVATLTKDLLCVGTAP